MVSNMQYNSGIIKRANCRRIIRAANALKRLQQVEKQASIKEAVNWFAMGQAAKNLWNGAKAGTKAYASRAMQLAGDLRNGNQTVGGLAQNAYSNARTMATPYVNKAVQFGKDVGSGKIDLMARGQNMAQNAWNGTKNYASNMAKGMSNGINDIRSGNMTLREGLGKGWDRVWRTGQYAPQLLTGATGTMGATMQGARNMLRQYGSIGGMALAAPAVYMGAASARQAARDPNARMGSPLNKTSAAMPDLTPVVKYVGKDLTKIRHALKQMYAGKLAVGAQRLASSDIAKGVAIGGGLLGARRIVKGNPNDTPFIN